LPLTLIHLVEDDADRRALGRRAKETILSQMGATFRTLEALQSLLRQGGDRRTRSVRAAHND
jgi:hypothetical protein